MIKNHNLIFFLILLNNLLFGYNYPFKIKVLLYKGDFKQFSGTHKINFKKNGEKNFYIYVDEKRSLSENGKKFLTLDGYLLIDGNKYSGTFICQRIKNTLYIINLLDLDNYVMGVVKKEISSSWPDEAIKAQAIIARSYAYTKYLANKNNIFYIHCTDKDQVFGGTYEIPESIKKNVNSVQNIIITYRNKPIECFFHSSCGGKTEEPKYVWNSKNNYYYYRSVRCYYCDNNPKYSWKKEISKEKLNQLMAPYSQKIGNIRQVRIAQKSPSGRVVAITLIGSKKSITIPGNKFRMLVGGNFLLSLKFKINSSGKKYVFHGNGFGHGVGLCQWGAYQMATEGKTYRQILSYYYKGIRLGKIR